MMFDRADWFRLGRAAILAATVVASGAGGGQSGDARDFDVILNDYRTQSSDGAVSRLLSWEAARLRRLPPPSAADDPRRTAAAALLHAEAAVRRNHAAGLAHLEISGRLMSTIVCPTAAETRDEPLLRFCREWHGALASWVHSRDVRTAIDRVADRLPPHASLFTATGIYHEHWMGPEVESGGLADYGQAIDARAGDVIESRHGRFSGATSGRAIRAYRRALELDPAAHEAGVRLGRVLWLLGRTEDAQRELELAQQAAERDGDGPSAYLASLFLGRLHEEAGRSGAALRAYDRAVASHPAFPAARLAAARLRWTMGAVAEGRKLVSALWDRSESSDVDPWTLYPHGRAYWERVEILAGLRQAVRK